MDRKSQGIQSVEFSFELLEAFLKIGAPVPLGEAAERLGIGKSKLHKYLTSFVRLGVIEQDASGCYSFGPKLLELGLGILGRMDMVTFCEPELHQLRLESGEAAALALWTVQGPLIVRFLESPRPVAVTMRVGFYAPVTSSAAGKCFAAHLPEAAYAHLAREELGNDVNALQAFEDKLQEIARQGFAIRSEPNQAIPGAKALACPIFDGQNVIVASILLIGFENGRDSRPDDAVKLLTESAERLSARLGHTASD